MLPYRVSSAQQSVQLPIGCWARSGFLFLMTSPKSTTPLVDFSLSCLENAQILSFFSLSFNSTKFNHFNLPKKKIHINFRVLLILFSNQNEERKSGLMLMSNLLTAIKKLVKGQEEKVKYRRQDATIKCYHRTTIKKEE